MLDKRIDYHRISRRGAMIINYLERSSNHSYGARCGNPVINRSFQKRSLCQGIGALFCMFTVLFLCSALVARAQELSATLSGIVSDSSGAVIPHAAVAITLSGVNGTVRIVESDASGNYVATNLTAGTYSITVTAAGFETYKGNDIVLDVAEKRAVNVQLKTGSTTTTVVVEDNPVSVDTETSGQAGTISGVQIRELEISSRNFEQLLTLQPGVVSQLGDEPSAGGTAMSVNGARTTANNWTVDGADINDSGSNGTVVSEPSMDAIQEITLERGNYDAGYGRSGGGQVLVATRSGGSSFHGEGYEYVRNTMFDANDWLNKQSQVAAGLPNQAGVNHHNVYGFTIGGPIYIPNHYNTNRNKTFFFWSEDWHKITSAASSVTIATPTTSEVGGVFAGDITAKYPQATYDPGTGMSTIPSSAFSANSQVYLTGLFAKNANSTGLLTLNLPAENSYRDDIVRIDHYFNDKLHFYARGMNDIMPVTEPLGLWAGNNYPGAAAAAVDSPGKNVVGNLTWTISPKVVNELEFVYSQGTYHSSFIGSPFATSSSALSALQPNTEEFNDPYGRLPAVAITGLTGFSAGSTPWKERNLDRSYFDNVALNFGKHTLRFGFQIQQMLKSENAVAGEASFSFGTGGAGDVPFADFLVGNVSQYTQQNKDTIPDLQYLNSEAYIQDDWKLSHKLTLNLGLRWSSLPSPEDKANILANFDPALYSPQLAPTIDPTTGNFNPGQSVGGFNLVPATYANGIIFPQGPACTTAQIYSSQVQCSPYGKTIDPTYSDNFAPRVGFAYNPDGHGVTSVRGGFGIFYDRVLNGIFEQSAFYDPPEVQSVTVNNTSFDKPLAVAGATNYGPNLLWTTGTPAFKVPNYADYNLTVERQLLPTTIVSAAYVGGRARHLIGEFDMNQPTIGSRLAADPNTDVNALRPYAGYSWFDTKGTIFTSNYNALQLVVQHRSRNLTIGGAYTWSKTLTTNSNDRGTASTDTYNLKDDYGPSTFNQPQTLIVNYVYNLPFFRGQNGLEGKVLGGWEFSGITSAYTGSNFSVVQASDPYACPTLATSGLCDPSSTLPGQGLRGLGIGTPDSHIAARVDQIAPVQMTKKVAQWFSTSSYQVAAGHFGNTGSGSLLGPGLQRWDMALAKNTKVGEYINIQLRAEAFDVFNHPNFSGVDDSISDGASFGTVNADHEPRILQLGAKVTF
jgi:Carboxypeptidase regulatory-like domain/TonB-dependent Receptor Plug Domain